MLESDYKPCKEQNISNAKKYFEDHLILAEQGDPFAQCQVGYFYQNGLGVEKDLEKQSGGHAGELTTATGTVRIIWPGSTRMESVGSLIWNRQPFGTGKPPCRAMILQSTNVKSWAFLWRMCPAIKKDCGRSSSVGCFR